MPDEIKKKRGRPPLSPELKAERAKKKMKYDKQYSKATKYARQKKYHSKRYEPKISIAADKKAILIGLTQKERTSIPGLFIMLVKDKYNIDLS